VVVLDNPSAAFPSPRKGKASLAASADEAVDNDEVEPDGTAIPEERTPVNRAKFLEILEKAQPSTTILLAEYEMLKSEHWLMRWAVAHGSGDAQAGPRVGIHLYNLPRNWEMPRWIESQARKLGGRINPDAAMRLAEMVGEDTRIADQELLKLLTYTGLERPVTLVDVNRVSVPGSQGDIFKLVDALGQRNGSQAQKVLHQLLEEEDAQALWGMIIRQFRLLLQVRELLDEGVPGPGIQKELRLHEYVAGKVTGQARRFTIQSLESIHHRLLEIDEAAKTGRMPLEVSLDTLVVELSR
jgi:DNA polymerase-3 subunit delta